MAEKKEQDMDPNLIEWEEFALTVEEHFHAEKRYHDDPTGPPLGHSKKKKKKARTKK